VIAPMRGRTSWRMESAGSLPCCIQGL
jgi:hypothetical protein